MEKIDKWEVSWRDCDGNFHLVILGKNELTEGYIADIESNFCCDITIKKITVEE